MKVKECGCNAVAFSCDIIQRHDPRTEKVWFVRCNACQKETSKHLNRNYAIQAWNKIAGDK